MCLLDTGRCSNQHCRRPPCLLSADGTDNGPPFPFGFPQCFDIEYAGNPSPEQIQVIYVISFSVRPYSSIRIIISILFVMFAFAPIKLKMPMVCISQQALVNSSAFCEQKVAYFCRNSPFTNKVTYKTCDGREQRGMIKSYLTFIDFQTFLLTFWNSV